jgi:hypothetical protein
MSPSSFTDFFNKHTVSFSQCFGPGETAVNKILTYPVEFTIYQKAFLD